MSSLWKRTCRRETINYIGFLILNDTSVVNYERWTLVIEAPNDILYEE